MERIECELPRRISLKELEKQSVSLEITATKAECTAIAERLSIDDVQDLIGAITLSMPSEEEAMVYDAMFDGLVINGKGRLKATLTQTCVVTLEPIETKIESSFEGIFTNGDPVESINEDSDEPMAALPDILGPIEDDGLDVGNVFIEQLALELDPFPRKQGVEFEGFSSNSGNSEENRKESPFAVLGKLKDNL